MSADDAPWVLALDGVECRICGHSIKLQYAAEGPKGPGSWRGFAQDLQLASSRPGPQSLIPTGACSSYFQAETRTMHADCWKIVESIWKSEFTMAELDGFLDVSADLASFLPEIPYTASPIKIDAGLTADGSGQKSHQLTTSTIYPISDDLLATMGAEGFQKPRLPDMKHHALPADLDRHVCRWLSDPSLNSEDVETLQNPTSLAYWLSVTRMLQTHPQFSDTSPEKMNQEMTQILRNLAAQENLNSFPHLVNYDIVYANAMTIVLALINLPLEEIHSEPDLNGNRARLQLSRDIKLPPALDTPAKLKLKFLTLRRKGAEGWPERNDLRVGMKYLRDIWFGPPEVEISTEPDDVVVLVPSFAGLRFFRDHVGVFVVLVKEGETWNSCWKQHEAIRWEDGIPDIESSAVEWQAGVGQPAILIVANTLRDMMLLDMSQNGSQKQKGSKRDKLKEMFGFSKN